MNIEVSLLLFAFLGMFIFFRFAFQNTLTPGIKYFIYKYFPQLSTNYFRELAKNQFDEATQQNNPDKAWNEVIFSKIREMGHAKTSYEKRKENLEYIRSTTPNRKIVAGLIEVLPLQHKLSFQQELACFICEGINRIGGSNNGDIAKSSIIADSLNAPLKAWNDIFSAWAASTALFAIIWHNLDKYSSISLFILCLIPFVFTSLPILRASLKWLSILSYFSFVFFSILIVLALYANFNHDGVGQQIIDLDKFGYTGIKVTINYPNWLTLDEIQACNTRNKLSVLVEGGDIPAPIRFNYNSTSLSARNSGCVEFTPEANNITTKGQAFEFYLSPLDRKFMNKEQTSIVPILVLSTGILELPDREIKINIEHLHWGYIRQALYFLYSGGTLSIVSIAVQFIFSLRKKV
jgi:hypothetical protein